MQTLKRQGIGGLAQLGEHLLCKQGVVGSIPSSSTNPQCEIVDLGELIRAVRSARFAPSDPSAASRARRIDYLALAIYPVRAVCALHIGCPSLTIFKK